MSDKFEAKDEILKFIFDNKMIIISLIVLLIAPGIWTLFFFNREQFWELDVLKLIVISVSMSMPVFVGCFLILIGCFVQNRLELDYESMVLMSELYTVFVFIVIIIAKLVKPMMVAEDGMFIGIILLLIFGLGNALGARRVRGK